MAGTQIGFGGYEVNPKPHKCVKVKSGKIVVLMKIFLNKATSYCFINLQPIFTIFSILVIVLVAMETILAGIYVLP